MKILVVDDDPVTRLLLQASLVGTGHQVQEAADGETAWHMIVNDAFRLVISDWMMPGLTGLELTRRIRSADFAGYVYIILLTVKSSKEDIVCGLEAGADDYLTKPFNPGEMRARVAIGERILKLEASLSESRDQMEHLATYDSLTGLLNRRAIFDRSEAEIQRSLRNGYPMGLLLIDVDRFKSVNDHYGHLIGDQALRLVADTLVLSKRSYDLVGRWGGEEFLLVLPDTTLDEAAMVADRLRQNIAATPLLLLDGSLLQLHISVGVSCFSPSDPVPLDRLLWQADTALYQAKRAGRNMIWLSGVNCAHILPRE